MHTLNWVLGHLHAWAPLKLVLSALSSSCWRAWWPPGSPVCNTRWAVKPDLHTSFHHMRKKIYIWMHKQNNTKNMKLKGISIKHREREQQCSLQVHVWSIAAVLQRKTCVCCFQCDDPQSHRCDRLEKNAAVATTKQDRQFVWEF